MLVSRSISSQVARLASPLRTPVNAIYRRQYLFAHQASESLMRARVLPSSEGAKIVVGDRFLLAQATGDARSCRVRCCSVTLGDAQFHDY